MMSACTWTICVWQPYYHAPLTAEDALAMLLGTSQLLAVVTRSPAEGNA